MQTFLPYPSFSESAKCLDNKRLGKQRVECKQIYLALTVPEYGWKNHPAVKMWRGYETSLLEYTMDICEEWIGRGFKDTVLYWAESVYMGAPAWSGFDPFWLGDEAFHASHRSNLLRKDNHYQQFGWKESFLLPYIWPVK